LNTCRMATSYPVRCEVDSATSRFTTDLLPCLLPQSNSSATPHGDLFSLYHAGELLKECVSGYSREVSCTDFMNNANGLQNMQIIDIQVVEANSSDSQQSCSFSDALIIVGPTFQDDASQCSTADLQSLATVSPRLVDSSASSDSSAVQGEQTLQGEHLALELDDFVKLPSLGSAGHSSGLCKPCGFLHHKLGCQAGVSCTFCHLCPAGTIEHRRKAKRQAMRASEAQSNRSNGMQHNPIIAPCTRPPPGLQLPQPRQALLPSHRLRSHCQHVSGN